MGFNLFLYGVIIFGLLVGKSYDYSTTPTNEDKDTIYNNTNKDNE